MHLFLETCIAALLKSPHRQRAGKSIIVASAYFPVYKEQLPSEIVERLIRLQYGKHEIYDIMR